MRLGIDFGGTNVKFGLFKEDGSTHRFIVKKLSEMQNDNELLTNLLNTAEEFSAGEILTCGGLSTKGLVDRVTGKLLEDVGAANEFAVVSLRDEFSTKFRIPFTVDNDARAYAFGEWKFGAGRNFNSVIVMTLGTGVGCAVIIDGRLFSSESPVSGVLGGHISIDRNGPECPCGNKGCLELYCSASALEKEVLAKFPELKNEDTPMKKFFESSYDIPQYKLLLTDFQENLAIGLVNIIHAYGINKIILGGGLMKSHREILPGLTRIVSERAWTVPRGSIEILPSELEDKAACLGAAFMNI
ncbi:MAG: ROK family protein [Ignavibacteriales bacterium]